jgi:hypothetical protein
MKRWNAAVKFFRAVILAILVIILVAEVIFYAPPFEARITAMVTISQESPGNFSISYSVSSTFAANLNATATIGNGVQAPSVLYFYYDSSYPFSWSLPVWAFGLSQHLGAVLAARNYHPSIVVLDANQLYGFLTSPSTQRSVLFMSTGVIPDTIFNKTTNYLAPWVRGGGTLLWFGDTIGFYSGQEDTPLEYASPSNPGLAGVSQFVNVSIFGSSNLLYENQSVASRAYDFTYYFGLNGHGLDLQTVQSEGGEVLGGIAGNYTNAARLPLGNGTIDYFAVPMLHDVTELTVSLANMLQSGVLTGPFQTVGLKSFSVAAGQSYHSALNLSIPYIPWLNSTSRLCLEIYQTDLLAIFGNVACVGIYQLASSVIPDVSPGGASLPFASRPDVARVVDA